jgi:hypothetical protein
MKRYLDTEILKAVVRDFRWIIKGVIASRGEFDLQLRRNYLNLYYKGNSIAKIVPAKGEYKVGINTKYGQNGSSIFDKRFAARLKLKSDYRWILLKPKELHPFFCQKHLNKLKLRVVRVNYGEEIVFEQMLFTDNLDNQKWILIDRQVTDRDLSGTRIDVLALRRVGEEGNNFQLVVLEVKLGKNKDLKGHVFAQLQGYVDHIQQEFADYKDCYEKNYRQKKELDLLPQQRPSTINIVPPVDGAVVVGWYSGVAMSYQSKGGTQPFPVIPFFHVLK